MSRKKYLIICSIIIFGIAVFIYSWESAHYTIKAQVIESDNIAETAFEDCTGNIWTVDKGNYIVGEDVRLIFNCNYTESDRTDDIIIGIERR